MLLDYGLSGWGLVQQAHLQVCALFIAANEIYREADNPLFKHGDFIREIYVWRLTEAAAPTLDNCRKLSLNPVRKFQMAEVSDFVIVPITRA